MKKHHLGVTLGAVVLAIPIAATAASVIVLGSPGANLDAAVNSAGGKVTKRLPAINAVVADGEDGLKSRVQQQSGVQGVAPNLVIQWLPDEDSVGGAEVVDPPGNPFGSIDVGFNLQWGHTAVRAVDAWNAGYKGEGAKVAVLDGGFSLTHRDIENQFDPACTADMTGEGIDYGPNPSDLSGQISHGNHVAGIIAAQYHHGASPIPYGTIGLAPEARLCLVKVLRNTGNGSFEDIVEGIIYAADKGVDVINMSLGAYLFKSGEAGLYTAREAAELKNLVARAVAYAHHRGALVVASAGNSAIDANKNRNQIHLPSDVPNVMSVSATAPRGWAINPTGFLDYPTPYTDYGRSAISIAAPGGYRWDDVPGTCRIVLLGDFPCAVQDLVFSIGARTPRGHVYYWAGGTSMAAAHVSGVAALVVSKFGKLHPAQLRTRLERGADDLGLRGNDPYYGAGRVNAIRSLQ